MIGYERHTAVRPARDGAGAGCVVIGRAGRSDRMAGLALVGMVLAGLGGCTFVEQTDDLLQGGPQKRIEEAEQRQRDAISEQQRLRETHRKLTEQQAAEERKLQQMRKRLAGQDARIARARENRRITEAEERALRARVAALGSEIQDLEFRIEAARTVGETGSDPQLEERLESLRRQAEHIETEIRALEE